MLVGADRGAYPAGNSVVVRGAGEAVIIDPSVTVVARGGAPVAVDAVINSHGHEDHLAGNGLFAAARVHIHDDDLLAARSLDGLMAVYGYDGEIADRRSRHRSSTSSTTSPGPTPSASATATSGISAARPSRRCTCPATPAATAASASTAAGCSSSSDIDLTGFGPYYGDVWSDLDDFEASLVKVRDEEAEHYVTFHHKGVIDGRDAFVRLLDDFHAVIGRRHDAMLEYLAEPRTIEEMAAHRFVYRPHVELTFVDRSSDARPSCTSPACSPGARRSRSSPAGSSAGERRRRRAALGACDRTRSDCCQ